MTEFILHVLGDYAVYTVVYGREFITLLAYTLALSWYKPKRQGYFIWLAAGIALGIILCVPLGILRTTFNNVYAKTALSCVQPLYIFGWLALLYRQPFATLGYTWTGIVAAKGFSGNFFALLLNMAGKNDLKTISFFDELIPLRDWTINYGIQIVILVVIYFFLRKQDRLSEDFQTKRNAVILAGLTFILSSPLYSVVHSFQSNDFALAVCCKLLFVIIYLFILVVRAGLFSRGQISQELKITEQLLHQEKKHYESVKDNIEIINMKCHDIKHQLDNFHGRLTERELEELREAIQIYDSNIKTGNEILETILFQKRLYCEKNGIRLKFMADGKLLGFVEGNDLYALITNALDNAAESVVKLADEDKRIIDFHVWRENASAVIEVANFFHPETYEGATAKEDKVHHGYGIRSMKYITQKYGGTLSISRENNIFTLTITLPVRDLKQDKKIYR